MEQYSDCLSSKKVNIDRYKWQGLQGKQREQPRTWNHLRASLKTKETEKTRVQMAGRRTSRILKSSQQSDKHKIKVLKDKGQSSPCPHHKGNQGGL